MTKKLLFVNAALALCFMAGQAENAVLDYSYAQDNYTLFGKDKKENIDVAICVNDPSLVGKKITAITAYISTSEGISNTSVWLSNELTLENRVNVPDITSVNVTPVAGQLGQYEFTMLSAQLDEPYVLTETPVYVGYSLTVDEIVTPQQKKPIVIAQPQNPNGLWLHASKSVLKWMEYSEKAGGVAVIVASIEGDYPDYSVAIKEYNPIYVSENESFTAEISVANVGAQPVNEISYTYTIDDDPQVYSGTYTPVVTITPNLTALHPLMLTFDGIEGLGAHYININLAQVNGQPNESVQAEYVCQVNVIPFVPVHRPLVEEYTGLWCGYCPRGFIGMEMVAEVYEGRAVGICYHNGDPMEVTSRYPMNVPGFPNASVDRITLIDPYYGDNNDNFGISHNIDSQIEALALADIDVEAYLDGENVNAAATVRFIQDFNNANYQTGFALIANGLTDPSWEQSNYYAGESGLEGTDLEVITTWGDPAKGLVFNDVLIDANAINGLPGSIPAEIMTAQSYTSDFTFNIEGNDLVQNLDNIYVAAFIINKTNGQIVNSNITKVNLDGQSDDSTAIKSVKNNLQVIEHEYMDLTGRKINNPTNGIYIITEKLSDGSTRSYKTVVRK